MRNFAPWKGRYATVSLLFSVLLVFSCNLSTSTETASVDETYLHIRASWSRDGKTIAFTSEVQNAIGVYLVDTSGANLRRLIGGEGYGVAWSPDSKWLCYSSASILYRIKADGDSLTRMNVYSGAIRPTWSPDGARIAFVQRDPPDISGIWFYDVRTGVATQFIGFGNYPSWHPSGKEIVVLEVQVERGSLGYAYSFLAVDVASTSMRIIAEFSSQADCGFCSISPQGDAITYGLVPGNDRAQVWRYNIAENRHIRLTDDGGDYPAWAPDGSKIVYTRTAPGDGGLWIMNADGSGKRRLTKP